MQLYMLWHWGTIIEKHVTLDKKLEGPDHKASIELQLRDLMSKISLLTKMSGDGKLDPQSCETANRKLFEGGCITTKSNQRPCPYNV